MESLNLKIELNDEQKKYKEECITFCMNNSYVLDFLEKNDLDLNFVSNHSSKLKEWALNKQTCATCKGLGNCTYHQGRYFELEMSDGFLTQRYAKCDFLKEEEKKNEYLKKYVVFHGDETMKLREFHQVDQSKTDLKEILSMSKQLMQSVNEDKGIYLCGKPGIGKTFLMNCLGHLYVKNGNTVAFVNSPTLISDIKNNFSVSGYSENILYRLKNCDVLIVDDIGGESISAWSRDEILMPLLNERMEKKKKTYFTSNYNYSELEEHFAIDTRGQVDKIKANRLMERIKALTSEKVLKGVNRR